MNLNNSVIEKISVEVIKTLVTRFDSFPTDTFNNRNAPFHEAFLNAFSDKLNDKVSDTPYFLSLSSWLHGLNTTLGQVFFENIAHHLSCGEKREYTSRRLGNLTITQSQGNYTSKIITDLSNSTKKPNLIEENSLLFSDYTDEIINSMDFSADIFIEDIDTITAIELKSVKPNSGEMKGEKLKILGGKAALYRLFPNKEIKFYIGFPFDPTANPKTEGVTGFNKTRFLKSIINMTKYFDPDETLIASELWDMLSGQENTMENILTIINTISTPNFLEKFQLLCDNSQRDSSGYKEQLLEWNLFSELELLENKSQIEKNIGTNKNLRRIYNKIIFDRRGNYNIERYNRLKELI